MKTFLLKYPAHIRFKPKVDRGKTYVYLGGVEFESVERARCSGYPDSDLVTVRYANGMTYPVQRELVADTRAKL